MNSTTNLQTKELNKKVLLDTYNKEINKLYSFFYYKVLSKDIAEDLTSETFVTFANILASSNQKEIENYTSFLYGIAKNIFIKYLQKKYKSELPFSYFGDDFENYVESFTQKERSSNNFEEQLLKYLPFIPAKQAAVLELRFIQKMSLLEICLKLGKNMNYVKTTQKRGFKSLKALIEKDI